MINRFWGHLRAVLQRLLAPVATMPRQDKWVACLVFLAAFWLESRYVWGLAGYDGDLAHHAKRALDWMNGVGNPLRVHRMFHLTVVLVSGFANSLDALKSATTIVMALFLTLRFVVVSWFVRELTGRTQAGPSQRWLPIFVSIASIIAMPLPWTPAGWERSVYFGSLLTNQFHNPTQTLNTPFAIFATFWVWRASAGRGKEQVERTRDWLTVILIVGLSAFAKPSFVTALAPALVVLAAARAIRERRWNTHATVAVFVIAAVLLAIWLNFEAGGILWAPLELVSARPGVAEYPFAFAAVLLLMPVALATATRWRSKEGWLGAIVLLLVATSLFQVAAFIEDGARGQAGNFAWSAIAVYAVLYPCTAALGSRRWFEGSRWRGGLATAVCAAHLISGVVYLHQVLDGVHRL